MALLFLLGCPSDAGTADTTDGADTTAEIDTAPEVDTTTPPEVDAEDTTPDLDDTEVDVADTTPDLEDTAPENDAAETTAPPLAAPVETDLNLRTWDKKGVVRGVFLAPSDRPFAVGLRERLHTLMVLARDFFADELAREGHLAPDGDGDGARLGFELELADDGLWDVVFLRSEHPASHFHAALPDAPGAALSEIFARLPEAAHRDAILVYFYDTHVVVGDGLQHTGQAGSAAPWMGEHAGYALIGAHALGVGFETVSLAAFGHGPTQAALFEDTTPSGLSDWDAEQVFGPLSVGAWASTYLGAALHELGHAFGLEHTFGDEDGDGVENNLMGNGFRRFGGRFSGAFPQPPTRLGVVSATALAPHPFLGPLAPDVGP